MITQMQKHLLVIAEGVHIHHNLVGLVLPPLRPDKEETAICYVYTRSISSYSKLTQEAFSGHYPPRWFVLYGYLKIAHTNLPKQRQRATTDHLCPALSKDYEHVMKEQNSHGFTPPEHLTHNSIMSVCTNPPKHLQRVVKKRVSFWKDGLILIVLNTHGEC